MKLIRKQWRWGLLVVLVGGMLYPRLAESALRYFTPPFGGGIRFTPTQATITAGSGAPNASAHKGSLYLRTTPTSDPLWVNESGSTTWKSVAIEAQAASFTDLTSTGVLYGANGTVSLPSLTFTSDADTGLYRIGANNLGITANGAKVVDVATTGVAVTGSLSATTSVAATTSVSAGTTVTGQFVQAADTTQTLAGSGSLVITAGKALFRVAGSGGAVTGCTAATGTTDGKTITVIGSSDANTVQFADGAGLNLGAATRTLGAGDTLRLVWNNTGSEWDELSFVNN